MRRVPYLLTIVGLLALIAAPASADHVTEPTAPITGIDLHVYQYPHPQTTTLSCSGSEVITFDNMRVESRVTATATPSEHWDQTLFLYRVNTTPGPGGTTREGQKRIWNVEWRHTNIPPHQAVFESHQTNQDLVDLTGAKLRWVDSITGRESGRTFSDSCTFIVG